MLQFRSFSQALLSLQPQYAATPRRAKPHNSHINRRELKYPVILSSLPEKQTT